MAPDQDGSGGPESLQERWGLRSGLRPRGHAEVLRGGSLRGPGLVVGEARGTHLRGYMRRATSMPGQ